MFPALFGVPTYFLIWGVAAIICTTLGTVAGKRAGFPTCRSLVAMVLFALPILLGSKLLYILETTFFPFDDYLPAIHRGSLHGFRIPGGVILLAFAGPFVCRILGLCWRRFGDAVIPVAALALVFIRLGCFFNGCCFGKLTTLPWAMSFPTGSVAYAYQLDQGWLTSSSRLSLPVHPLQLYLCLAAVALFLILTAPIIRSMSSERPGLRQLLFYTLFFGSSAALEPLRANFLALNNILMPAAALVSLGRLYVHSTRVDNLESAA